MIEREQMCKSCHERSEVGEFKAGRNRMTDGLEKTGGHTTSAKAPAEYTYFRCRDCGEKWMLAEDSSLGSSSRYLSRRAI